MMSVQLRSYVCMSPTTIGHVYLCSFFPFYLFSIEFYQHPVVTSPSFDYNFMSILHTLYDNSFSYRTSDPIHIYININMPISNESESGSVSNPTQIIHPSINQNAKRKTQAKNPFKSKAKKSKAKRPYPHPGPQQRPRSSSSSSSS